jgi:glucans biosynthesis protein C
MDIAIPLTLKPVTTEMNTIEVLQEILTAPETRLYFIDNIPIFLSILVVCHHLYFAMLIGMWPLYPPGLETDPFSVAAGFIFMQINQAYFMGLFFFISGHFTTASFEKKRGKYIVDRAIRLLTPIAVYELVLKPILIILIIYVWEVHFLAKPICSGILILRTTISWITVCGSSLQFIFNVVYSIIRQWSTVDNYLSSQWHPLNDNQVKLTTLQMAKMGTIESSILAFVTFLVRCIFPVGFWVPILGQLGISLLTPAYLPEYVMRFSLGIACFLTRSLKKLPLYPSLNGACISLLVFIALVLFELATFETSFAHGRRQHLAVLLVSQ